MPYVLTDPAGRISAGLADEMDLTRSATLKRRAIEGVPSAKDPRWITIYDTLDEALFLAPMHARGRAPRVWQVAASVAKSGDTLRKVTAEIAQPTEVVGASMSDARRIAIGLALEPYLADHARFAAWKAKVEKADLRAMGSVELDWLAAEAAAWSHRAEWEAGQKGLAFDLGAIIAATAIKGKRS